MASVIETINRIRLLPETLTNKIAAGEVVNRPASVVKELVENAIDSGADDISVILKDGGKALIQVVDNGAGMNESDLMLAFQRHATSKIYTYEDLTKIATLGFRGEALASIASVAQVEARSVMKGASAGHRLEVEGGVMRAVEASAGAPGTSITVKNIFFNTPARRKFLKSNLAEYRQIVATMNHFSFSNPEISFTFVNEGNIVFELAPESMLERIGSVLGARIRKNMVEINNDSPVKIKGYVGNQDAIRRSRGDQYLYFNQRFFTSKNLNYAVAAAFGEVLPRGSYPIYAICIEMDAESADVNVHPTKMEIKFANDALIFSSIRGAIKRALTSQNIIPEFSPWQKKDFSANKPDFRTGFTQQTELSHGKQLNFVTNQQLPGWPEQPLPNQQSESPPSAVSAAEAASSNMQTQSEARQPSFERVNVWQVHNKYIISQIKNGLIVIDQHVAHERILYEKALDSFEKRKPSSQQLLFPQVIELSQYDYALLLEMIPFLENIGFVVKAFSKNTIVVEGVPTDIKIKDDEKILLQILDQYKRSKSNQPEIRENVAASFACHSATRSGDPLTREEMNALIDQLFSTREPYFCPHGRPVIVHVSLDELDKRFKRT